jgi:hypothetical protein
VTYADLLDSQRTLLSVRLVAAQLRTEREKALAAIETWSAVDVEAMKPGRISIQGGRTGGAPSGKASMGGTESSSSGGGGM